MLNSLLKGQVAKVIQKVINTGEPRAVGGQASGRAFWILSILHSDLLCDLGKAPTISEPQFPHVNKGLDWVI